MKATKIEFEFGYNDSLTFASFFNVTFDEAYKKLIKQFKNIIIYSVKTEY